MSSFMWQSSRQRKQHHINNKGRQRGKALTDGLIREEEAAAAAAAAEQERRRTSPNLSVLDTAPIDTGCRLDRSNLDCFLDHTTPSVQCEFPLKAHLVDGCYEERMPYFSLGNLWSCFDEWSAYGTGVPLILPSGETIVQYYVPYLSAIQIYLRPTSSCTLFSKHRRPGDESDWSEFSSELSCECSSDTEADKISRLQMKPESWETASSASSGRSSVLEEATIDQTERHGDLIFEYFERSSPYGRAPLAGKINELAAEFPLLHSLKSIELASASWVSVAWYPIYCIPTGPTMRDLATCFLSFHSLWTPPMLQDSNTPLEKGLKKRDHVEEGGCTCNFTDGLMDNEHDAIDECGPLHSSWRVKESGMLELPAFGLASYKLRGPFWASAAPADKRKASSLASSADSWIRQLKVQHPDFDFFASRGGINGRC